VEGGRLAGIVSDRDVRSAMSLAARSFMTVRPMTVTPDTPVEYAARLMLERRFSALPVMDGSAAPFVYLIRSAGIFEQRDERQMVRIRRKISVVDGDRSISIEPARDFRVSYAVDFGHPAILRQEIELGPLSPERFERDISAARTFGFLRDVHVLWDGGFARGGSLANTVVLDDEKVVNPEGLRWADEFVRHKVLDLCGDLALLGLPVCGRVRVERGGHELHQRLVSAILANPDAWTIGGASATRGILLPSFSESARP